MKNIQKNKQGKVTLGLVISITLIFILIFGGAFALYTFKGRKLNTRDLAAAEKTMDLHFTNKERTLMLPGLKRRLGQFEALRKIQIPNSIPPAVQFNPLVPGMEIKSERKPFAFKPDPGVKIPDNFEDLAFFPVTKLASLIKNRRITSTQLTKLYLKRLKKYGPKLHCVITLTEKLALEQAKRADEEIAAGHYRGPLHGIPWGAKDLLAVKGYKTTWGAMPYKDQGIDVFVSPAYRGGILQATNLTGHPAVVIPTSNPTDTGGTSSITFIGNLYKEAETLRVAAAYQEVTSFHLAHPDLDKTAGPGRKSPPQK